MPLRAWPPPEHLGERTGRMQQLQYDVCAETQQALGRHACRSSALLESMHFESSVCAGTQQALSLIHI
eukprot:7068780-Alexandrium_andersonii.AAC.1